MRAWALVLLGLAGCEREKAHFPPLKDPPPKVAELVRWGDALFAKAMRHLERSDPQVDPDGWPAENRAALDLFTRANREGYFPAQDVYGSDPAPAELLDRSREAAQRAFFCRKRAVSTRR